LVLGRYIDCTLTMPPITLGAAKPSTHALGDGVINMVDGVGYRGLT